MIGRVCVGAEVYADRERIGQEKVLSPDEWLEVYRWVASDTGIPDKEDVLALIRYHYGDFDKLDELLRYLDGGRPYAYLSRHILPRICKWNESQATLSAVALSLPATKALPVVKIETGSIIPSARPAVIADPKKGADAKQAADVRKVTGERTAADEKPQAAAKQESVKEERRTVLALKNNLLYDLALAPNVEMELPISRRWSLNAEYKCPWWLNSSRNFCYQLLSGGIEARIWMGNRTLHKRLTGHFLGIYAEGGRYDFQLGSEEGYQGKYYGAAGLAYGYSRRLAHHLAIEFSVGVGYLTTKYRTYTLYDGDLIWKTSNKYYFIGPTKAKISLVWLITRRR